MTGSEKTLLILFLIFFGLSTFLVGRFVAVKSISPDSGQELALANNSLINRFNRTEEKYAPPKGLVKLSNDEGRFLKLSADGKEILYYAPRTGQIRSVPFANVSERELRPSGLIGEVKTGFRKINWSADGRKLIASDKDTGVYYDLANSVSKRMAPDISSPVFGRSGEKIAYVRFDPETGEGGIGLADTGLENLKKIINTHSGDWAIDWINSRTLSLLSFPESSSVHSLFALDVETGDLKKILEEKEGLAVKWSPNGQRLLYSHLDGRAHKLFIREENGDEQPLDLAIPADKCVWSADSATLVCADKELFVSVDSAKANAKPMILLTDSSAALAEELVLSPAQKYLVFRNSQTGKLYGFSLNQ